MSLSDGRNDVETEICAHLANCKHSVPLDRRHERDWGAETVCGRDPAAEPTRRYLRRVSAPQPAPATGGVRTNTANYRGRHPDGRGFPVVNAGLRPDTISLY